MAGEVSQWDPHRHRALLCALIGAGLSCPFPLLISAAARTAGTAPSRAISALVTVGYTGDLLGPPLVGALAQLFSLRAALTVLALAGLALFLLGSYAQPRDSITAPVNAQS